MMCWTFAINSPASAVQKMTTKKTHFYFLLQYFVMSSGWCLLTQEWPQVIQRSSNAFRPGEIRNRGYSGWKMASLFYQRVTLVALISSWTVLLAGILQKLEASLLRPCKSLTKPIIFVERKTWLELEIVTQFGLMYMVCICFLNSISRSKRTFVTIKLES